MENKVRILVVEDEIAILEMVQDALDEAGFAVTAANDVQTATKMLDDQGAEFRGLITDVNLGSSQTTGWDIAKQAREINDQLPIVYMTGGNAHEWSINGVPNSVLIVKPFASAQIVTAISQLINLGSTPTA